MGRQVEGTAIAAAGLDGHSHSAATEAEVDQLGDGQPVFAQDVVAHHPQLGLAIGHVHRHIGIAHQQSLGGSTGAGYAQQPVVRIEQGREIETGGSEASHRVLEQRPFGQGHSEGRGSAQRHRQGPRHDMARIMKPEPQSGLYRWPSPNRA